MVLLPAYLRDSAILLLCLGWMAMSVIPTTAPAETYTLFGVEHPDKAWFFYDLVNKGGGLIGAIMLLVPNKTVLIRILIPTFFCDCLYEVLDLVFTGDVGDTGGVITQILFMLLGFIFALYKECKVKTAYYTIEDD